MAGDVLPYTHIYGEDGKIKAVLMDTLDIVFTSYGQVTKSCPYPDKKTEKWMKKQNKNDEACGIPEWIQMHIKEGDVLHNRHWYRVSSSII